MEKFAYLKDLDLKLNNKNEKCFSYSEILEFAKQPNLNELGSINPFDVLDFMGIYKNPENGTRHDNTDLHKNSEHQISFLNDEIVTGTNKGNRKAPVIEIVSANCKENDARYLASVIEVLLYKVFDSKELKLDIYSEIYYSLVCRKNKENYVPIFLKDWSNLTMPVEDSTVEGKLVKEYFLEKRRNYRKRYDKYEWSIDAKDNFEKIINVAPNVSRLWILEDDFRQMLRPAKYDQKKYNFTPKKILNCCNKYSLKLFVDDKWVLEQLMGFDLALSLYDLLNTIFSKMDQASREVCYKEVGKLVNAIMEWPGLYSRKILVKALEMYYLNRCDSEKDIDVNNLLNTFSEELIMFSKKHVEKYEILLNDVLYNEKIKGKGDIDKILENVNNECRKLRESIWGDETKIVLELDSRFSYLVKDKLYKIIQGNVISNRKK